MYDILHNITNNISFLPTFSILYIIIVAYEISLNLFERIKSQLIFQAYESCQKYPIKNACVHTFHRPFLLPEL